MGNLFSKNNDNEIRANTAILKAYFASKMNLYSELNIEKIKKLYVQNNSELKNKKSLKKSKKTAEFANEELIHIISELKKNSTDFSPFKNFNTSDFSAADTISINTVQAKTEELQNSNIMLKEKLHDLISILREKQKAIKKNFEKLQMQDETKTRRNRRCLSTEIPENVRKSGSFMLSPYKNNTHIDHHNSRTNSELPYYHYNLSSEAFNSNHLNKSLISLDFNPQIIITDSSPVLKQRKSSYYISPEENIDKYISNSLAYNSENKKNEFMMNCAKRKSQVNKNLSYSSGDYALLGLSSQNKDLGRYRSIKNKLSSTLLLTSKHVYLHSRLTLKNDIEDNLNQAKLELLENVESRKKTIKELEKIIENNDEISDYSVEESRNSEDINMLEILKRKIIILEKEIAEYNYKKEFISKINSIKGGVDSFQRIPYARQTKFSKNEKISIDASNN